MLSNLQDRGLRPLRGQGTPLTSKPRDIRTDKSIATSNLSTHHPRFANPSHIMEHPPVQPTHKYFETSGWKFVNSINIGKQT
ncbi:hypothetical protein CEXT_430551 [Caerostris extrusa]|uniref:Uncharacterized protein n=1 Tax=Caerostris extrusa TaxID=172846 RepID=A0AAV4VTR5_CAEEX|nr:hypothetical protein CEXT_430551 [Caerostris extrusa]